MRTGLLCRLLFSWLTAWSSELTDLSWTVETRLSKGSAAVTSRGYNLATGRFVLPVDVLMLAALTRPSSPAMVSSTTASRQLIRGVSSWTRMTAPGFTCLNVGITGSVELSQTS